MNINASSLLVQGPRKLGSISTANVNTSKIVPNNLFIEDKEKTNKAIVLSSNYQNPLKSF